MEVFTRISPALSAQDFLTTSASPKVDTEGVQIVLNRAKSKTRVNEAEVVQALGHPIAWRVTNDYSAMTAAAFGQPVVLAQPKTQLAKDICSISRQLAGVPSESRRSLPWRRTRHTSVKLPSRSDDTLATFHSTH